MMIELVNDFLSGRTKTGSAQESSALAFIDQVCAAAEDAQEVAGIRRDHKGPMRWERAMSVRTNLWHNLFRTAYASPESVCRHLDDDHPEPTLLFLRPARAMCLHCFERTIEPVDPAIGKSDAELWAMGGHVACDACGRKSFPSIEESIWRVPQMAQLFHFIAPCLWLCRACRDSLRYDRQEVPTRFRSAT